MFDNASSLQYHIFEDYNMPFDEKGTTCGVIRKVQWVKAGSEPDESKAKLELRKVYISGDQEKVGKGYTFATEEGPSELAVSLVKLGYGDTKEILRAVRKREDFQTAATTINDDNDGSDDGEMFDMRDLFYNETEEDEEGIA